MNTQTLPTKLNKEPLVDVVFEIRFSPSTPASSVLPGFFFAKLEPVQWRVEPLPMADIPKQFRSNDPNLRYQPLMRIYWDSFILLVSDNSLGLGCNLPYPGWINFKAQIIKAVGLLAETKIIESIERYSLKYVDIIEGKNLPERIQMVNMDIRVGSHVVREELFTVRVEISHNNFLTVRQIAAEATATPHGGKERNGTLIDTDTICNYQSSNLKIFIEELPTRLDAIHIENKTMFFDCLKPETISYLEPVYD
jgi:uncharacterized protein (TIGR04255 family)